MRMQLVPRPAAQREQPARLHCCQHYKQYTALSSFLCFIIPFFLSVFLSLFCYCCLAWLVSVVFAFFLSVFLSSFLSSCLPFFLSAFFPFCLCFSCLSFFLSSGLPSFLSFFPPLLLSFLLWFFLCWKQTRKIDRKNQKNRQTNTAPHGVCLEACLALSWYDGTAWYNLTGIRKGIQWYSALRTLWQIGLARARELCRDKFRES